MPLKCIAIDDEPLALELIESFCSQMPSLQLVRTFEDAISGAEYLRNGGIDLLFLDINMPDISGIDLARSLTVKPMIIFTTAYRDFAYQGFELDAVDYLVKPFSFERFSKAVKKALDFHLYKLTSSEQVKPSECIYVHSEYRMIKVDLNDIQYIETLEDYIRIHLTTSKPIMTLMTLKKVLEKLPPERFKQIHRSYVVAMDKVSSIHNRKVTLSSAIKLPVSITYAGFIHEWQKGMK
ncbi:MAG: two component transcriptional regulator, LytTR family [Daejeonella sp.]|nr:two component transcriptional regulator, LytTR family [Daejeonella sp.]